MSQNGLNFQQVLHLILLIQKQLNKLKSPSPTTRTKSHSHRAIRHRQPDTSPRKKIAKKQLIKKGAMQKLLNPINNGQLTMDNYQLSTANYPLKKGGLRRRWGRLEKHMEDCRVNQKLIFQMEIQNTFHL